MHVVIAQVKDIVLRPTSDGRSSKENALEVFCGFRFENENPYFHSLTYMKWISWKVKTLPQSSKRRLAPKTTGKKLGMYLYLLFTKYSFPHKDIPAGFLLTYLDFGSTYFLFLSILTVCRYINRFLNNGLLVLQYFTAQFYYFPNINIELYWALHLDRFLHSHFKNMNVLGLYYFGFILFIFIGLTNAVSCDICDHFCYFFRLIRVVLRVRSKDNSS